MRTYQVQMDPPFEPKWTELYYTEEALPPIEPKCTEPYYTKEAPH